MSIWAEIKKGINSDFLNEPLDAKTDRIETNLGSNADASSDVGSVHAKLKDLKTTSNIKSIQRGITFITNPESINVTISSVTTSKTMVNHCGVSTDGVQDDRSNVRLSLSNSTTLNLSKNNVNGNNYVSWEVIEYV